MCLPDPAPGQDKIPERLHAEYGAKEEAAGGEPGLADGRAG